MSGKSLNRSDSTLSKKDLDYEPLDHYECCAQWSLLVVNLPLMLIGIAFIIVGVWTMSEYAFVQALQAPESQSQFEALFVIFIVVGVVLMVLSVLGCVASLVESRTTLMVYYVAVIVVFAIVLVCVVVGYAYKAQLVADLRLELRDAIPKYDPGKPKNPVTEAWDRTQKGRDRTGERGFS